MPSLCFRPALPHDRRQIRLLLRHCDLAPRPQTLVNPQIKLHKPRGSWLGRWQVGWRQVWQYFSLGLLLALGLHWLFSSGGFSFLLYGVLSLSAVPLVGWLNLRLFADWRNYWVVAQGNQLLACGKLTCYRTYAVLSDVVVEPNYRGQGMGSFLVSSIAHRVTIRVGGRLNTRPTTACLVGPVYLACIPQLMRFYQRFGFRKIASQQLTTYLKRELGLQERRELEAMVLLGIEPELAPSFYRAE